MASIYETYVDNHADLTETWEDIKKDPNALDEDNSSSRYWLVENQIEPTKHALGKKHWELVQLQGLKGYSLPSGTTADQANVESSSKGHFDEDKQVAEANTEMAKFGKAFYDKINSMKAAWPTMSQAEKDAVEFDPLRENYILPSGENPYEQFVQNYPNLRQTWSDISQGKDTLSARYWLGEMNLIKEIGLDVDDPFTEAQRIDAGYPSSGKEKEPTSYVTMTSCFVDGVQVELVDGSEKNVSEISVGDEVKTDKGDGVVTKIYPSKAGGQKLYGFNDKEPFVTEAHPFMTQDGWKKISDVTEGDTLYRNGKGIVTVESITSIEIPEDTPVYNFHVDGHETYFADGYLVHNKTYDTSDVHVGGAGSPYLGTAYKRPGVLDWQDIMPTDTRLASQRGLIADKGALYQPHSRAADIPTGLLNYRVPQDLYKEVTYGGKKLVTKRMLWTTTRLAPRTHSVHCSVNIQPEWEQPRQVPETICIE